MANERMDIIAAVRSRDGSKSYWTRVGVAFPSKGGGWSLFLDYVPTARNDEGRMQLLMVEPGEKDSSRGGGGGGGGRGAPRRDEPPSRDSLDDDIPF
jgi:hypothetical protein